MSVHDRKNLKSALESAILYLQKQGVEEARQDAWLLLEHVCGISHSTYFVHSEDEMPKEQQEQYEALVRKRGEHIPLQQLTGEAWFYGIPFFVIAQVLLRRQDAALLLFLCGASSILLEASSWALDETGVLRLRWAFLSKQERIIRGEALAALTIERPLFFRLLGASRVVLYPVGQPAKRAVTLYLYKEDAQELADRLMPVRDPVCHRPAGGERAALVVLGANGLSTLALTGHFPSPPRPWPSPG